MAIKALAKVLRKAANSLHAKDGLRWVVKTSRHFQDRLLERFEERDLDALERAIEMAAKKAKPGTERFRYTHPAFGVTVVISRHGLNLVELITCWKQEGVAHA